MMVLLHLLAWITWIPGLILFGIQADMAGWDWTRDHLWLAWGLFAGLFTWSVVLSLIALAISAWVAMEGRGRRAILILGLFFAGAGFGAAINAW